MPVSSAGYHSCPNRTGDSVPKVVLVNGVDLSISIFAASNSDVASLSINLIAKTPMQNDSFSDPNSNEFGDIGFSPSSSIIGGKQSVCNISSRDETVES